MPGLGSLGFLQIGKETTYGTPVAATDKTEIISAKTDPVVSTIDDPSLFNAASLRGIYQGPLLYSGTVGVRLNYVGKALLKMLNGVMGGVTTTLVEAATSWDHVFKEAISLPSYTLEVGEGDIPTGKVSDVEGTKFASMTIRGSAAAGTQGMLTGDFEITAKNKLTNQTGAALSFPTVSPMLFHHALTVDDGSADANIRVRSFEVALRNNLTGIERAYFSTSPTIDEPLRDSVLDVTWTITQEFQTMTHFTAAQAFTDTSPKLVFRGPALGANFFEFELRSNKAKVADYSAPVERYGIILATVTHRAYYDATDASALVVRVRNGESAV